MVATAVEALGFHSVSTSERLLLPATPGWKNDFGLPEYPVYDAIETLTWVAARTSRIKLGTEFCSHSSSRLSCSRAGWPPLISFLGESGNRDWSGLVAARVRGGRRSPLPARRRF